MKFANQYEILDTPDTICKCLLLSLSRTSAVTKLAGISANPIPTKKTRFDVFLI
jgi:hypothetical protein